MTKRFIDYFEVCGDDYRMGTLIGKHFHDYLAGIEAGFAAMLPGHIERVKALEANLAVKLPRCLAEIYGRADGAGVSRDVMLLIMFPEIYGGTDGCTTAYLKTKRTAMLAHNEDSATMNIDNVALVRYDYGDRQLLAYTSAIRLAGSAFAFNSAGMAFSSNHIFGGARDMDEISRFILLRDIINSASIEEAAEKVRVVDVASPFNLNILDMRTFTLCNIERDLHDLHIEYIGDRYTHSNHYCTKPYDATRVPINSVFRREKSRALLSALDETATLDDMLAVLSYEGDGYDCSVFERREKYPDRICTVATFAVDPQTDDIRVLDFIGQGLFRFSRSCRILSTTPLPSPA